MCEAFPFKPIKMKDVIWKGNHNDFSASISFAGREYVLRVEQMDDSCWWGCFYINDTLECDNIGDWGQTEKQAKRHVLRELNKFRKNRCY